MNISKPQSINETRNNSDKLLVANLVVAESQKIVSEIQRKTLLKQNNVIVTENKTQSNLDVCDLLVHYLEQMGVEYIFGVPGGAIEPLYNAMARSARRGGLRPVIARHETGAAFMAQGYAKETGKLGVCCATTGPGATNALTGIASAYYDEVPLLLITGQTSQQKFGRGALQDSSHNGVNTLGIFDHCTCYNTLITDITQFEAELTTALMVAIDRRGPVHITLPVDLMRQSMQIAKPSYDINRLLEKPVLIDFKSLKKLAESVFSAKKIAIVVGEACENSIREIINFAEIIGATIISTPGAKGLIDPYNQNYKGVFGFAGHTCARESLHDPGVDVILAVGTALGEWDTAGWDTSAIMNSRLIHITSSITHLTRSPMAQSHVRGDIKTIFNYLLKQTKKQSNNLTIKQAAQSHPKVTVHTDEYRQPLYVESTYTQFSDDSNGIKPQALMMQLAKCLPDNSRILVDAGNSTAWAVHYLFLDTKFDLKIERGGWFRLSTQFASMGWAIGNAIGAAIGNRKVPVVCITGDGSLLMNGQEFTVAIAEKLKVIFVVLNDSAFGMVKHGQRLACAEEIAFELPTVDFCSMAKAMGGHAVQIRSVTDLQSLDFINLCKDGPALLDVYIDTEEVPPMATRVKVLGGELDGGVDK